MAWKEADVEERIAALAAPADAALVDVAKVLANVGPA